ncbi:YceD family protein [Thermanaerovibrio acidaminovorans]|uniref:DUF177 domain-containing protein n=1 Tax=Thermanaerovibrio acidaminovorans (strain ATCC 49978 / DSM 6589 / Su883) TaxID=525903 RepID=D1B5P5_THEAS|nr:DUF177 domain-containing protein [Thermanaerovibrio acidaminovorans]ACZ19336.1 protein of unknown function DUF177 [Thermanaerovibrio acidaminovorans DSM 6589]
MVDSELQFPSRGGRWLKLNAIPDDGSPLEEDLLVRVDPVGGYSFPQGVVFHLSVSRTGGNLLFRVSLRGEGAGECARCLAPVGFVLEGEDVFLVTIGGEVSQEAFQEEDFWCNLDTWADKIDLAPMLWEVLASSLPSRVVCDDRCLGLCPFCGANLNRGPCACGGAPLDPRMEALRIKLQELGEEER